MKPVLTIVALKSYFINSNECVRQLDLNTQKCTIKQDMKYGISKFTARTWGVTSTVNRTDNFPFVGKIIFV